MLLLFTPVLCSSQENIRNLQLLPNLERDPSLQQGDAFLLRDCCLLHHTHPNHVIRVHSSNSETLLSSVPNLRPQLGVSVLFLCFCDPPITVCVFSGSHKPKDPPWLVLVQSEQKRKKAPPPPPPGPATPSNTSLGEEGSSRPSSPSDPSNPFEEDDDDDENKGNEEEEGEEGGAVPPSVSVNHPWYRIRQAADLGEGETRPFRSTSPGSAKSKKRPAPRAPKLPARTPGRYSQNGKLTFMLLPKGQHQNCCSSWCEVVSEFLSKCCVSANVFWRFPIPRLFFGFNHQS